MKPVTRSYILLELSCSKEVPDLTDKVAGRCYTLDGVENTSALMLDSDEAFRLAQVQKEAEYG